MFHIYIGTLYIYINYIYRQGGRDQSHLIPNLHPDLNFIHIHACTPTSWPDLEVGIYLRIAVTFKKRQIQHDVNKKRYWSWSLGAGCSGRFRSRFGYIIKGAESFNFLKITRKFRFLYLVIIFLKQNFFM